MLSPRIKLLIGISLILGVVVWMGAEGIQAGKSYYVTVDELAEMKQEAVGKRLRVAGFVQEGSIRREAGGLQFKMVLAGEPLPVVYRGRTPVPDTFQPRIQAVVEGQVTNQGVFEADHIQAKCASKYEAELESLRPNSSDS